MTGTGTPHTGSLAGRPVGRIGFGAMQLERHAHGGPGGRATGVAVLHRAVELGVNHIDTAPFYGAGAVDGLIREALRPYRDDLVLVGKVGAVAVDGGLATAQRPAELRAQVEDELRLLGAERLDVVNIRRADRAPGIVATGDQVVDLDDQLAELSALRDEGKVGTIGLSHVSPEQVRRAAPAGIVCVQNLYNVLDRSAEDLLAECAARDIAFVPYFPLGSAFGDRIGALGALRHVSDHPVVRSAAGRLGATPSQVALGWLLAHDPHILLIPGTGSVAHLEENVAAAGLALPADIRAELDGLAMR